MSTQNEALEALRRNQEFRAARMKELGPGNFAKLHHGLMLKLIQVLIPIVESGGELEIPEGISKMAEDELKRFIEDVNKVVEGRQPEFPYGEDFQTVFEYFAFRPEARKSRSSFLQKCFAPFRKS